MQRALVWINLYGHEAVRHKLKNSLKTITYSKMCFFVQDVSMIHRYKDLLLLYSELFTTGFPTVLFGTLE